MTTYHHLAPEQVFTLFETVRFGRSRIPPQLVRAYFSDSVLSPGLGTWRRPVAAVPRSSVAVARGTNTETYGAEIFTSAPIGADHGAATGFSHSGPSVRSHVHEPYDR